MLDILNSLKRTRKGNLQYDRSWVKEGRAKDILHSVASLTQLHQIPDQNHTFQDSSQHSEEEKGDVNSRPIISKIKSDSVSTEYHEDLQGNCFKLLEYEEKRKKNVQEAIQALKCEINFLGEQNQREIEIQMDLLQQGWKLEKQRQLDLIMQLEIQQLIEVKEQQNKIKENQKTHAKRLNEKMKEMEERQREFEELEQKRKQEQEEWQHQLLSYQSQLEFITSGFVEIFNGCIQPEFLQVKPQEHHQLILNAQNTLQQLLLSSAENNSLSVEDMHQAQTILLNIKAMLSAAQIDVAKANIKARDIEIRANLLKSEDKNLNTSSSEEASEVIKPEPDSASTLNQNHSVQVSASKKNTSKDLGIFSGCVDAEAYGLYENLMIELKKWEDSYKTLETDDKLKKYRFELKKAVNTPVNAISSQTGRQLRDKLDRLLSLLGSVPVLNTGGKPVVSCQMHPQGTHFCAHLLAKKIVSQAESQVASHPEAAFPLASVAVGLWGRYPKFGELLLAQIYTRCPYLFPIYHPQKKEQDEKEYFMCLGYIYEDGEMEPQEQFLKRMSGIVRLYGALMQAVPLPNYITSHPHGIQYGWQFLSRLVNLRPRFDITATVLFHFLEVAGNSLYKVYGKQMNKLIFSLEREYMDQIRKVSAGESQGPVTRLQTFLTDTVKRGRIAPPEGMLSLGFWNT